MNIKIKTREEWIKEYQGLSPMDLRFFLSLAQGCLRGDLRMVEVCDPDEREDWKACVEQGEWRMK